MGFEGDFKRLMGIVSYKVHGTTTVRKKNQHRRFRKTHIPKGGLDSFLDISNLEFCNCNPDIITYVTKMYCEHRYDYLGSGWVKNGYGNKVLGMAEYCYEEKYPSVKEYFQDLKNIVDIDEYTELQKLRSMISSEYESICWNRDYKSGYTWGIEYIDEVCGISTPEGADIKTVWELGRLQFLLQIAIGALIFPECREQYILEFRNVILDFLSANPVGIGVSWMLPMEAAIRATNILLAFDILNQIDEKRLLDTDFVEMVTKSVYQHGQFIYDNLETDIFQSFNGNHYYSNVIGLLYISSYLKRLGEAKKWYRFAKKEYFRESKKQFFEDGGNIEASTSYHRLVSEMMLFGAAILMRNGEEIPDSIKNRMTGAVFLTKVITKKNGNIVQIGDNDSGRMVNTIIYGNFMENEKAEQVYNNLKGYTAMYGKEEDYFDENILCHYSMIRYYNGLYHCEELMDGSDSFEASFIRSISNKEPQEAVIEYNYRQEIRDDGKRELVGEFEKNTVFTYEDNKVNKCNQWGYFPEFGLYYYKDDLTNFYLYTGGKQGRLRIGHSHNDILHCELNLAGEDLLFDRGAYVYTAMRQERNWFRGSKSHFTPDYGYEPRKMEGIFGYLGSEKAVVRELGANRIKVEYETDAIRHQRNVAIKAGKITISDYGNAEFALPQRKGWYSNGYGKISMIEDGNA